MQPGSPSRRARSRPGTRRPASPRRSTCRAGRPAPRHAGGRTLGWLVRPALTRDCLAATGTAAERQASRGRDYVVELVYRAKVLASTAADRADRPAARRAARRQRLYAVRRRHALLTTISPNGDGFRDAANVRFALREPATVTMEVTRTVKVPIVDLHADRAVRMPAHTMIWAPGRTSTRAPTSSGCTRSTACGTRSSTARRTRSSAVIRAAPVVRVQGIDAGFAKPSYLPGRLAAHPRRDRRSRADAARVPLRARAGRHVRRQPVRRHRGRRRADRPIDWSAGTSKPHTIALPRARIVPSGLYYVQFDARPTAASATRPFVVRPHCSARRAACSSCCRPTRGRPTTSRTSNGERLRRHVVRRPAEP